jgi:hypothetical protein
MSATSPVSTPRPRPLALVGGGKCLKPKRGERPMDVHCVLEKSEYDRLVAFVHAVFQRTGRRISHQSVMATAASEFLNRNRAWMAPIDVQQAGD